MSRKIIEAVVINEKVTGKQLYESKVAKYSSNTYDKVYYAFSAIGIELKKLSNESKIITELGIRVDKSNIKATNFVKKFSFKRVSNIGAHSQDKPGDSEEDFVLTDKKEIANCLKELMKVSGEKRVVSFIDEEAEICEVVDYNNFKVPSRDIQKMKEYYGKGSNPKALANTVKTLDKAVSRYYISVATGWSECAQTFYDRCLALGATEQNLASIYHQAIKDKSIDLGAAKSDTPNKVSEPKKRKVVKAKDDTEDVFPFF